jgi:uncharacterized delta-60 repeat protein
MTLRILKVILILLIGFLNVKAQPGRIDSTFVTDFDFTTGQQISTIYSRPNGDIVAGGNFIINLLDGFKLGNFIKYDSSGKFNHKWNQGKGFDRFVRFILPLEQDKLFIVGDFLKYHDTNCELLARLNKDYSLDLTYKAPVYISVVGAAMQSDGKVVLHVFKPGNVSTLLRLNKDGSLDSSFGELKPGHVIKLLTQADDKIVLTGTGFQNGIKRLSKDGIADATFNAAAHKLTNLLSAAIQTDGKIIIAGSDAQFKMNVLRLNVDGSIDTSFKPVVAKDVSSGAFSIFIQKDNKIILGGRFIVEDKHIYNNIVRLNSDGTVDTTFKTGTGFNSFVNVIAPYGDNKIMVGGNFNSYNGELASRIIRLIIEEEPIVPLKETSKLSILPNPVQGQLFIESTELIKNLTVTDALGRETMNAAPNSSKFSIEMGHFAAGVYILKLRSENLNITRKILRN